MTLEELTHVLSNNVSVIIKLLSSTRKAETIYKGKLYQYSTTIEEKWPENNFKNFNVIKVRITEGYLDILIED